MDKEDKFLSKLKKGLEKSKRHKSKSSKKKQRHHKHKKVRVKKHKKIKSPAIHHKIKKEKKRKVESVRDTPTLQLRTEPEIALDFATKAYQQFNKIIKSVILFGSTAKQENTRGSDIDIMIIIDDATIRWDQELIAWYREELEKLVRKNPYKKDLHINTIKLTTWWEDLLRGDPVVINIIRDGESLIDFGGFFEPLKYLLLAGKIKATPESVHSLLERAPIHILNSKTAEMSSVEGLYWAMVDSAQAALIALGIMPSSPENIALDLKENFVNKNMLKMKYVLWYRDLLMLHKKIVHREINDLKGVEIDEWQERAEEFLQVMAKLVNEIISQK
ncbi:MAG: nucleotidyltransferase domain-containing protein [archaeon]